MLWSFCGGIYNQAGEPGEVNPFAEQWERFLHAQPGAVRLTLRVADPAGRKLYGHVSMNALWPAALANLRSSVRSGISSDSASAT